MNDSIQKTLDFILKEITELKAKQELLNTQLDHLEGEVQILKEGFSEITESFLVTTYVGALKKRSGGTILPPIFEEKGLKIRDKSSAYKRDPFKSLAISEICFTALYLEHKSCN